MYFRLMAKTREDEYAALGEWELVRAEVLMCHHAVSQADKLLSKILLRTTNHFMLDEKLRC